ncbi:hypothetical protein MSAN_02071900 [Mycena sanguinolenta]|uniref:DUF6699 domain-containing protein n=1 Tax=Mycena sanguinolenta TaxID=230812 RepID=A0A8H6XJN4_9AGAR|nr:hypothetical protein MSAN_02071900 [Mycena sanguinolenta]
MIAHPTMSTRRVRFSETVEEYEHEDENPLNLPPPLTPILVPHSALRPNECEPLDFSLPSTLLRTDSRLDSTILDEPACALAYPEIHIRVPSSNGMRGLCTVALLTPCTVGDVLTALHNNLRQPPETREGVEQDVEWFHSRRVDTLASYCADLDKLTRLEIISTEAATGARRIDLLRGKVSFAGTTVPDPTEPHRWELLLDFAQRYAKP